MLDSTELMEPSMTLSSRPEPCRSTARRPHGFTLIELLVVMGIILVLISILLPAINRAHRNATRISMMGDMSVISQALDAYRAQFGDYPRTGLGAKVNSTIANTPVTGAATLCWALVAPGPARQDGAGNTSGTDNGAPGFRLRSSTQGTVYGPFIPLDRFRLGIVGASPSIAVNTLPGNRPYDDTQTVLADRYGNVILYFPANTAAAPTKAFIGNYTPGSPTSPLPVYNYGDNAQPTGVLLPTLPSPPVPPGTPTLTKRMFAYRLGNTSMTGTINGGEIPVVVPYLLWSAGPDGQFGPPLNSSNTTSGEDDDIVYPDQVLAIPAMQKP
jgi:prepilin-type N-terminal cleavage/methylation domain-containing protein